MGKSLSLDMLVHVTDSAGLFVESFSLETLISLSLSNLSSLMLIALLSLFSEQVILPLLTQWFHDGKVVGVGYLTLYFGSCKLICICHLFSKLIFHLQPR